MVFADCFVLDNWNVTLSTVIMSHFNFLHVLSLHILYIELQTLKCINSVIKCYAAPYSYFPNTIIQILGIAHKVSKDLLYWTHTWYISWVSFQITNLSLFVQLNRQNSIMSSDAAVPHEMFQFIPWIQFWLTSNCSSLLFTSSKNIHIDSASVFTFLLMFVTTSNSFL